MNRRKFENLFVPLSDLEKKERKLLLTAPSFRPPAFGGWGQALNLRLRNEQREHMTLHRCYNFSIQQAEEEAMFQVQSLGRFQREMAAMNLTPDCIFNVES